MHSIRRATLRAAATRGSRAAVVATPRLAWAPKATGTNLPLSSAAVFSRSFVTTRWLANQFESADQGEGISEDKPVESTEESAVSPETEGEATSYTKGQDTPYGLFVRNLVFDANEEHLMDAFSKYGEIVKASVARDVRGLSRGYAFVFFTNAEDMNRAAAGANGSFWHGRRIHASPRLKTSSRNTAAPDEDRARTPLTERTPTNSLYIGNIPYETTDAELNKLFRSLDNVTDVRIAVDRSTGWPRGFAHADFSSEEAAMAAGVKLESMTLLGRQLRIDFSQAKRPSSGTRRLSGDLTDSGEEGQ